VRSAAHSNQEGIDTRFNPGDLPGQDFSSANAAAVVHQLVGGITRGLGLLASSKFFGRGNVILNASRPAPSSARGVLGVARRWRRRRTGRLRRRWEGRHRRVPGQHGGVVYPALLGRPTDAYSWGCPSCRDVAVPKDEAAARGATRCWGSQAARAGPSSCLEEYCRFESNNHAKPAEIRGDRRGGALHGAGGVWSGLKGGRRNPL